MTPGDEGVERGLHGELGLADARLAERDDDVHVSIVQQLDVTALVNRARREPRALDERKSGERAVTQRGVGPLRGEPIGGAVEV